MLMNYLNSSPSPEKMMTAGFDKLVKMKQLTVKHSLDILELALNSIGITSFAREFELVEIIENITHYEKLITTIPGINNRLGSVILAKIRIINTFTNLAQLQAFAGVEPSIYQSGQLDTQGKILKRGSSHIRWTLIQTAIKVAKYFPTLKAYFRTKLAHEKYYNVTISHVAKKLIRVLFHMLPEPQRF